MFGNFAVREVYNLEELKVVAPANFAKFDEKVWS